MSQRLGSGTPGQLQPNDYMGSEKECPSCPGGLTVPASQVSQLSHTHASPAAFARCRNRPTSDLDIPVSSAMSRTDLPAFTPSTTA